MQSLLGAPAAAQPTPIPLSADPVVAVSWSADGGWLAVAMATGGGVRTQVWVVRPDGTQARRIAGSADVHAELGPWTRSGHRLAVSTPSDQPGGGTQAYLADPATGELTPLAGGEGYALVGHKWFFSAPMSDGFLVLAQAPGGLTCLLMPRRLPDGAKNAFRIMRLKDKLGDWSNASSEVEFCAAQAWRVGEEGRGVATIIETPEGVRVAVTGYRLPPGAHGLHIHAVGRCDPPEFTTASGHFNPGNKQHGKLNPAGPHAGDLPNLVVAASGEGGIDVTTRAYPEDGLTPSALLGESSWTTSQPAAAQSDVA